MITVEFFRRIDLVQCSDTASDVYSKFLSSILGIVGLGVNGFDLSSACLKFGYKVKNKM